MALALCGIKCNNININYCYYPIRSKRSVGRDEIYDDPSEADAVQMQPSPAYATIHAVRQSNLDTYRVTIVPSPAYQDWCMRI